MKPEPFPGPPRGTLSKSEQLMMLKQKFLIYCVDDLTLTPGKGNDKKNESPHVISCVSCPHNWVPTSSTGQVVWDPR